MIARALYALFLLFVAVSGVMIFIVYLAAVCFLLYLRLSRRPWSLRFYRLFLFHYVLLVVVSSLALTLHLSYVLLYDSLVGFFPAGDVWRMVAALMCDVVGAVFGVFVAYGVSVVSRRYLVLFRRRMFLGDGEV